MTPEERIEKLEQQVETLANLLGIRFLDPEEIDQQLVHTVDGERTRAEVEAHRQELGLDFEEYADRFCGCDEHVIRRAQKDLGLPEGA